MNAIDLLNALRIEDATKACAQTLIETWRKASPNKNDGEILREKLDSMSLADREDAPKTLEHLAMIVAKIFVKKNLRKMQTK